MRVCQSAYTYIYFWLCASFYILSRREKKAMCVAGLSKIDPFLSPVSIHWHFMSIGLCWNCPTSHLGDSAADGWVMTLVVDTRLGPLGKSWHRKSIWSRDKSPMNHKNLVMDKLSSLQCGPQTIAKLVYNFNFTMVYDTYSYSIPGVDTPTNITSTRSHIGSQQQVRTVTIGSTLGEFSHIIHH